jgi:hypothetical protein
MKPIFNKYFLAFFLFTYSLMTNAQIGIGQWREHLPYKKCIAVENAGSRVYVATPYSIFYFGKEDNSIHRLSKINGLSDIGISQIAFNKNLQCLIIAYTNTNVDLIKDDQIINIPDIRRKPIIGNKTINNIHIDGNLAYLSCGFGIIVLDMAREEIKDTYYIGTNASQVNVLDLTKNDTAFFAATDEGLYTANINSPNLADFSYWHHNINIPYPYEKYNLITTFTNKIIINKRNEGYNTDSLFVYDGIEWTKLEDEFHLDNHSLEVFNDKLYISRNEDILIYNKQLNIASKIYAPSQISITPFDISEDNKGNVWIADKRKGLIKTWNNGNNGESIVLEGPDFPDTFAMDIVDNDLWVVAGGYTSIFAPLYKRKGFYSFKNEKWNSFNCQNKEYEFLALDTIRDMVSVKINPFDKNIVYIGSLESGVLEVKDNAITNVFNETNSSLQSVIKDIKRTIVTGMQIDQSNNLWVLNPGIPNILSVHTNTEDWYSFNLGTSNSNIDAEKLLIDSYGQKWIIPKRAFSLIVYTDNQSIENTADDEVKNLSAQAGNGKLFTSRTLCMVQDLDGELWFGTDKGIGVIYSPDNVFKGSNFDMVRILVKWDDYIQYLLETETVTSIAIDAANRKWVGTENSGIYLLSQDGEKQLHHFTAENSSLLSNEITAIKINAEGEVFIGTSLGLVSYRGEAAVPSIKGSKVYAYPNPVREGYSGSIAIKNLSEDANVKITDVSGNLVYETHALGGQAIWNGYNFKGKKAHTGVYLVFASNEDGSVNLVTKILFIN